MRYLQTEHKNENFITYCNCLVTWRIFEVLEMPFFGPDHCYKDIDQVVSFASSTLLTHNAITLWDLCVLLSAAYNNRFCVSWMVSLRNWGELCEIQKGLNNTLQILQFLSFVSLESQIPLANPRSRYIQPVERDDYVRKDFVGVFHNLQLE